jgi:ABC-type multidrug transport system fused ATPase/permease subunit
MSHEKIPLLKGQIQGSDGADEEDKDEEKDKDETPSVLRAVLQNTEGQKKELAINFAIAICVGTLNVIWPFLISRIIDRIQTDEGKKDELSDLPTLTLIILAGLSFILSKVLSSVKDYFSDKLSMQVSSNLSEKIVQKICQRDYSSYKEIGTGLKNIIPLHVRRGTEKIFYSSFFLFPLGVEITAANVTLFYLMRNPIFGTIFSTTVVASTIAGFFARKCILEQSEDEKAEAEQQVAKQSSETLDNYETQIIFNHVSQRIEGLNKAFRELKEISDKSSYRQALISSSQILFVASANLCVLGVAEWVLKEGGGKHVPWLDLKTEADDLVFIFSYLPGSIDNIIHAGYYLKEFFDGYANLKTAIGYLNVPDKGLQSIQQDGKKSLNNIQEIEVIIGEKEENGFEVSVWKNPVSHKIEGSMTALVGPSGCGKSTIIRELCNFSRSDNNVDIKINISMNGEEYRDVKRIENDILWDNIILVPQEAQVYDENLKKNLELAVPEEIKEIFVKDDKKYFLGKLVEKTCEKLEFTIPEIKAKKEYSLDKLIEEICEKVGLEQLLKEEKSAINFSGGEKQRIGIARALLKYKAYITVHPEKRFVFIFDESTSALDNETEAKIVKEIYKLNDEGNLIVIIAHRLPIIVEANEIVFLSKELNDPNQKNQNNPQVLSKGSHYNLLKNGRYKSFYEASPCTEEIDQVLHGFIEDKKEYSVDQFNDALSSFYPNERRTLLQKGKDVWYVFEEQKVENQEKKIYKGLLSAFAVHFDKSGDYVKEDLLRINEVLDNILEKYGKEKCDMHLFFPYQEVSTDTEIGQWKMLELKLTAYYGTDHIDNEEEKKRIKIRGTISDNIPRLKNNRDRLGVWRKFLKDKKGFSNVNVTDGSENLKISRFQIGYVVLEMALNVFQKGFESKKLNDNGKKLTPEDYEKLLKHQIRNMIKSKNIKNISPAKAVRDESGQAEDSYKPANTGGGGDCLFHAIFGKWNIAKDCFFYEDVDSRRKVVGQAIRKCEQNDPLYKFIRKAIQALIMGNEDKVGKNLKEMRQAYKDYQSNSGKLNQDAWGKFEIELKKHLGLIEYIKEYCEKNKPNLSLNSQKLKFDTCLQDKDSNLANKIKSISEVDKAYKTYIKQCDQKFSWNERVKPESIKDYAEFVETRGQELLHADLHVIAHVFNITVKYYTKNIFNEPIPYDTCNEEANTQEISICFNGHNHYERMASKNEIGGNIYSPVYSSVLSQPASKNTLATATSTRIGTTTAITTTDVSRTTTTTITTNVPGTTTMTSVSTSPAPH